MDNKKEITRLIDTFYDIISGKAEELRDWDRFRSLFYKRAQLSIYRVNDEKMCETLPCDVETYIDRLSNFLANKDFYENGYDYEVEVVGNIAQVKSKYKAKVSQEDIIPIKIGTNLVQLINIGTEWKILNMLWEDE